MRNYKSTHIQYQIPKDYLNKANIVSTMPTLVIIAEQSPEQNLFLHKILASVQLVDQQNTSIEIYEFEGLKWLFCYEIQTYQTDETKKRQLWNALKTLKQLK